MQKAFGIHWAVGVLGVPGLVLAALGCAVAAQAQGRAALLSEARSLEGAFTDVYARAEPAVVTVFPETEVRDPEARLHYGVGRIAQGIGSGFIIDERGYVITNEHVLRQGSRYSVQLSDGRKYDARLVGRDQLLDIALVQIVVPREERGQTFPTVPLGDSDALEPGMWALALGNPVGFYFDDAAPVMAVGVVSGVNRTFVKKERGPTEGPHVYGGLIQTDAAINSGNSGGPLLNIWGEVVGVTTCSFTPKDDNFRVSFAPEEANIGINFAVPINVVKRKVPLLKRGDGVRRPMRYGTINATIITLSKAEAGKLHLEGRRGVHIKKVTKGGAAAKAGLQADDVILKVNGRRTANRKQLVCLIAHLPIGEAASFELSRVVKDKPVTMTVNVTLGGKTVTDVEAMMQWLSAGGPEER